MTSPATAELFCLHGFLGGGSDWDTVFATGKAARSIHAVDWLAELGAAAPSWSQIAARVNAWALSVGAPRAALEKSRRILVGYSLGGRVAMHALLASPAQWSGAVIVAANPGLRSVAEREQRLTHDREWARSFRTEAWDAVIADWNAQSVFAGEAAPMARRESVAAREAAVAALERFSLARQDDLRPALRRLALPVLWVAGARDTKYVTLMRECAALNSRFRYAEVPGAGHRAPWTGAAYFEMVVRDWIETVPIMASHEHEDAQPT